MNKLENIGNKLLLTGGMMAGVGSCFGVVTVAAGIQVITALTIPILASIGLFFLGIMIAPLSPFVHTVYIISFWMTLMALSASAAVVIGSLIMTVALSITALCLVLLGLSAIVGKNICDCIQNKIYSSTYNILN